MGWLTAICSALVAPVATAELAVGDWSYRAQSAVQWQPYGADVFKRASKTKRPLFVLVYKDDCAWCRKYETESIETAAILKRLRQDYLPVAVDAAKQPFLAQD